MTVESSGGNALAVVRAELVQDYIVANPVGVSPELQSARSADGGIVVFSVGTDNDVYVVQAAPDTASGWVARPLYAPAPIVAIAAGSDASGRVVLLAVDEDGLAWWLDDAPWSVWRQLGRPFGAAELTLGAVRAGTGEEGELLFGGVVTNTAGQQAVLRIYPQTAPHWDYVTPFFEPGSPIWDALPTAVPTGVAQAVNAADMPLGSPLRSGAFVSLSSQRLRTSLVDFYQAHQIRLRTYRDDKDADIYLLAGTAARTGRTDLFMATGTGQLYYLDQTKGPNEGLVSIEGLPEGVAIEAVVAATAPRASQLLLDVLVLGSDGHLYHAGQRPEDGGYTWTPLLDLGGGLQPGPGNLTLSVDGDGALQCFAVAGGSGPAAGGLVQFWRDSSSDWTLRPVRMVDDVKPGDSAIEIAAYATEITVVDSSGNPLAGVSTTLFASENVLGEVNGVHVRLGPIVAREVRTNALGRLSITSPTGKLGTPSLRLHCAALGEGALSIRPDQLVQDALLPGSAEELQQQLTSQQITTGEGNTEYLIPSQYRTDDTVMEAASEAIYNSMSLAQPSADAAEAAGERLFFGSDRRGLTWQADGKGFADRIDPSAVVEQHWRVSFTEAGPVFERLDDRAHAERVAADLRALDRSAKASLWSFNKPSWGDLWHSIRRGAAKLTNVIVSTVVDASSGVVRAITSLVHAAIGTLDAVVDYVVDKVQQAFDIVLSVFDAIETGFTRVFNWLGKLFDWDAIMAAQGQLEQFALGMIGQVLPGKLTEIESQLLETLSGLIGKPPPSLGEHGQTTFGEAQAQGAEQGAEAGAKAPGPSDNWAQNKLVNSGGGGPTTEPPLTPSELDAAQTFWSKLLEALGGQLSELGQQLSAALEANPDFGSWTLQQLYTEIGEVFFDATVELIEAVVEVLFEAAQAFLSVVEGWLQRAWHVPLLSKVWEGLVGEALTLGSVLSLVLAVPGSIAAKALGVSFPDLGPDLIARLDATSLRDLLSGSSPSLFQVQAKDSEDVDLVPASKVLSWVWSTALIVSGAFTLLTGIPALGETTAKYWLNLVSLTAYLFTLIISFVSLVFANVAGAGVFTSIAVYLGWVLDLVAWLFNVGGSILSYRKRDSWIEDDIKTNELLEPAFELIDAAFGVALAIVSILEGVAKWAEQGPGLDSGLEVFQDVFAAISRIVSPFQEAKGELKLLVWGGGVSLGTFGAAGLNLVRPFLADQVPHTDR